MEVNGWRSLGVLTLDPNKKKKNHGHNSNFKTWYLDLLTYFMHIIYLTFILGQLYNQLD